MTSRILLVDDEPDIREIIRFELEQIEGDREILEASSGKEALKIIKESSIDVVISDIRMPEGDGIELLKNIREYNSVSPSVLLVSGHADISHIEAYEMGAETLLPKPIDFELLQNKLNEIIVRGPLEHRRKDYRYVVDLCTQFKDGFCINDVPLFDLSKGGLFIKVESGELPKIGDVMSLSIQCKDDNSVLDCKGVCRWLREEEQKDRPRGVGIEFTDNDKMIEEKINKLVERLSQT